MFVILMLITVLAAVILLVVLVYLYLRPLYIKYHQSYLRFLKIKKLI